MRYSLRHIDDDGNLHIGPLTDFDPRKYVLTLTPRDAVNSRNRDVEDC